MGGGVGCGGGGGGWGVGGCGVGGVGCGVGCGVGGGGWGVGWGVGWGGGGCGVGCGVGCGGVFRIVFRKWDTLDLFKKHLTTFVLKVPDKPPIRGYSSPNSNSILDWRNEKNVSTNTFSGGWGL